MKSSFKVLTIMILLLICSPAFSESSTDALSTCMSDNLNGKERKNLAKWIFFAMGMHPDIKSYLNVSPNDMQTSDEYVGALITRLLTVDCSARLKTAYKSDPTSLNKAFEVVGRVAMQELMRSNEVNKALTNYVEFSDTTKIGEVMK